MIAYNYFSKNNDCIHPRERYRIMIYFLLTFFFSIYILFFVFSHFFIIFSGLYRYKIRDLLMVTGFHNNSPQFQFVRKQDVVLSVDVEKTSEDELLEAMTQAKHLIKPFHLVLTDYTSYDYVSIVPGHYVLFWELKTERSADVPKFNPMTIEQCCSTVEESLNYLYKNCRKGNTVGPLEIRVVEQGTFDALMDFYISKGSSVSQYKTPRCIKLEEAFKILDSKVVGRYFSQKVPT